MGPEVEVLASERRKVSVDEPEEVEPNVQKLPLEHQEELEEVHVRHQDENGLKKTVRPSDVHPFSSRPQPRPTMGPSIEETLYTPEQRARDPLVDQLFPSGRLYDDPKPPSPRDTRGNGGSPLPLGSSTEGRGV